MGVRDRREREVLDQLLGLLHTIEISTKITQQAGLWRREYRKSHGTGIIDFKTSIAPKALTQLEEAPSSRLAASGLSYLIQALSLVLLTLVVVQLGINLAHY